MAVGTIGASAHRSSAGTSDTTVEFDTVPVDHFGGVGSSPGEHTVPGDCHVSTAVQWQAGVEGGARHGVGIDVNGDRKTSRRRIVPGATSEGSIPAEHVGKTLHALSAGDVVEVAVLQRIPPSPIVDTILAGEYTSPVTIDKGG